VRRLILVLASIGVAVLLASGAALGITNGNPDNGGHPYVGALVDFPKNPDKGTPYPYCTGTLISDTVFLTAAHCGNEGEAVEVTFEEEEFSSLTPSTTYDGTFEAHPNIDIAVVVLDDPIQGITPALLPSLNRLEAPDVGRREKYDKFTAVGYGGQEPVNEPGWGPSIDYNDEREWAVSAYKSVNRTYLSLSQNLKQGNGGTCYGDSGGPNLFGAYKTATQTDVIAGITSTGDSWCKATNVTVRVDTKPVQDFLSGYDVTLPSDTDTVPQ
jgi:hypothetical protein